MATQRSKDQAVAVLKEIANRAAGSASAVELLADALDEAFAEGQQLERDLALLQRAAGGPRAMQTAAERRIIMQGEEFTIRVDPALGDDIIEIRSGKQRLRARIQRDD